MRSYEDCAFCSRIALLQQYVISWSIWMAPGQTGQDLDMYTPLVSSVCCHCAAVEGSTVSPLIHVNQAQDWPDFVMSNAKQHCIDNFCQDTLLDRNLSPPPPMLGKMNELIRHMLGGFGVCPYLLRTFVFLFFTLLWLWNDIKKKVFCLAEGDFI